MRTAGGFYGNSRQTIGTVLRSRHSRRHRLFSLQQIDLLNDKKYGKGNNAKTYDCIEEYTDIEGNCAGENLKSE